MIVNEMTGIDVKCHRNTHLAFDIAFLFYRMALYQDAATYLNLSLKTRGVSYEKQELLLLCYCRRKEYHSAKDHLAELCEIDQTDALQPNNSDLNEIKDELPLLNNGTAI